MDSIRDFLDFVSASPSAFHAAREVADRLTSHGFSEDTLVSPGGHVLVDGGAVIAWWIPDVPNPAFRIVGSHTDSPGLMLKPQPDFTSHGFHQLAVEVYGGPILASWFDRELSFAGRIVLADGTQRLVETGPIARVPHLAIHLERTNELKPDKQVHMQPVMSVAQGDSIMDVIADAADVDKHYIMAHEMISVDTHEGVVFNDLIAAGRMDNLTSVYASMQAMINAKEDTHDIIVMAAFNHEEVGSQTTTGAGGPLLERVLNRIAVEYGDPMEMLASSTMVSADAAHSLHPNYASKHDPTHQPLLNEGPVLKINANQRYASDAVTEALWMRACQAVDVPVQTFVGNNAVPCGSTIGPIAATRLGIPTVDVGVPLLSMHSARELAGVQDQIWFTKALTAYLTGN
ncbi:M18 family aminopeptidase [Corynebacterium breve]|uniref:M18 family aminopeptidase n=1 Tax=Corynebacterium breve TaxID=3049799 RepID=A0ABY8VJL8_9CORY|nr:M18 family aminopeptidase [Corynebacterium breve]WIM68843.1 M18 family aminopeptidase [Corynebacterium breve]